MNPPDQSLFEQSFEDFWSHLRRPLGGPGRPVVVCSQDDLHWLHDGERETHAVVGPEYHLAKRLAHTPVTLFLATTRGARPDTLDGLLGALEAHQDGLAVGEHAVEASTLQGLLRACRRYLEDPGVAEGRPSHTAVRALSDAAYEPITRLVSAAAAHEVERLHERTEAIRQDVSAEDWSQTYFAVVTGVQPRYKELSVTWFRRYLAATSAVRGGQWHRVVVAEGDHDLDSVLELVAKRDANRRVAEVFTGSPRGLDQDVLGEAASRAIDAVLAPVRAPIKT